MFNLIRRSAEWGGKTLVLESGKIARQASGAVMVSYAGTTVLATVVTGKTKEPVDFLPLTVQFVAKSYAVGKIPGGFLKREGKPSDRETLISRLIDRSIRPLFPAGFYDEISIVCNLLSYDTVTPPEVTALVGATAALSISGVPFNGLVVGARVGYLPSEGKYLLNASADEMLCSSLDLFLSGNEDSVLMVESEASELSESQMLGAITFGHQHCQEVINLIKEFSHESGQTPIDFIPHDISSLVSDIESSYKEDFSLAYSNTIKKERVLKLEELRGKVLSEVADKYSAGDVECSDQDIVTALKTFERSLVRSKIIDTSSRIDGRAFDEIRDIEIEVDVLPKAHGSALFTRGNTQALVVTALGTPQDEQIVDDLDGDRRENFLLHYNFPPYAVGESAALRAPGRREIGHGKLAWRAIRYVLPEKSDFPYTIRVVSEITESDGSSSMATVCGASLALMDTGVPIKSPVAGIAMGLIKEDDRFIILSDILGDEDHLGDMDFKVAGTAEGVTALQMDMKISGIDIDIIEKALLQAKDGRMHILSKMNAVIQESRNRIKNHAPRIESIFINKDKIRNVIGSGGKNIRDICEKTGAKIEIIQDGTVMIYAVNNEAVEYAKSMIMDIVTEPEIGKVFEGTVVEIMKFGAFVSFLGGKKGLVHISEIRNEHISSVGSVISLNDKVKVLVIGIDREHIQLSMRRVDQESGEPIDGELYNIRKNSFSDDSCGSTGGSSFKESYNPNSRHGSHEKKRSGGSSRSSRRNSNGPNYYREDLPSSNGFGNNNRSFSNSRNGHDVPRKPRFF
ncbi:polyribonucleotide nucleotidyltransferase [Ehrlichia chaffeensis str. Heartland]|uniref:Polyribonucleotide nucleotidyltransferase n=1 Tax=Ehrlichia chaffeensis (strain ATCC CRL-10679 / Arkansas) TaxID=205920 RepID=PNP_EHRCR|nr:polyribonucleotide nucleotidyltransferase [Ehrlichia chaffeensis]Q2GGA4.1 RecName: Full=Polyribonucleotide nucleotidyltransferase; AltName: Full=Polynucleotide phosphorylase; Short=PNPase [Ehrlichia chaffeensis str. Arkansas]ABD45222.1 polyribonucleotide nucleotidyltransferase [Ehrlichia chaffeensis str. Arkansas]AHX03795.1 polyribonucleotide nucleotidyltransferase [Ehrlichia chaffeensis str. Heartland]AHX05479.1 polyribonucleotide nucleotidyltransferase [Ehrlichia chaffeensis str. Jax]AHX0